MSHAAEVDPTPSGRFAAVEPVVLYSTFREADTDRREALAGTLSDLASGHPEHVLLHTCHRVELVAVASVGWQAPELSGMRVSHGAEAVERTLLVVGGLDSAVLAEEQLLGQARAAYEAALSTGATGPVLNELLRRAIRFGRRVRSLAQPGGDRSLAQRAVRWIDERLGPESRPASALVIGSGQMGRLLAVELAARGMTIAIASRNLEAATRLCAALPRAERVRAIELEEALARAGRFDLIAVATRSPLPIVEARHLRSGTPPPLVIDLSAPRNVAEDAARLLGDRLVDLDRLGETSHSALSDAAQRRVRAAAVEERDRFIEWLSTRASADGLAMLTRHAADVRRRHLDRLRRGGRLDGEQLAAVEAAATAMVGELLHGPMVKLRHDPEAAATVRQLFGIEK